MSHIPLQDTFYVLKGKMREGLRHIDKTYCWLLDYIMLIHLTLVGTKDLE